MGENLLNNGMDNAIRKHILTYLSVVVYVWIG